MKRQVIVIHGGNPYINEEQYIGQLKEKTVYLDALKESSRRWNRNLDKFLDTDKFQCIFPVMPCKQRAVYEEWKIWFERHLPLLDKEVILVGHSLGGSFLTKYLTENNIDKKILSLHLVASPVTGGVTDDLGDFTPNKDLFSKLSEICEDIHLCFSKDDTVVSFDQMNHYTEALPNANQHIFKDRGHFSGTEFPELVENIKKNDN